MLPDLRTRTDTQSPAPNHTLTKRPDMRHAPWIPLAASWLPALGVVVVGLALLPRLAEYAQHSWDVLTFPWQLDFDEGINLNASWLLSQGVNIYRPNPPDHFISSMYPPLYFALNAAAIKLFGLNLASGKLLAFAGALGAGAALWAWVYAETKRHIAGALSTLLWFSLGPVYVWSTFYKQDMLALALGLAGGALAARWARNNPNPLDILFPVNPTDDERKRNTSLFWAILPLSLSFWVKQSSLAPMAAVALFILLLDWRLAVRWSMVAAGSIAVPFLALDLLLKGGLHTHILAFDYYGRSAARLGKNLDALWTQHAPLMLCALAFLALSLAALVKQLKTQNSKLKTPVSVLYLLIVAPAALLSNSLPTANYNHLLDILAPLCLVMGVALGMAWRGMGVGETRMRAAWATAVVTILALALIQVTMFYNKPGWTWYTPLGMPLAERAERMQKLSETVRQTQGDVLSEDNWLLLHNGKRALYDDPAAMAALANAGAWDQSALLQDINRRKFSLVILQYDLTNETYNPRWNDEVLKALKANYEVRFRDVLFSHAPRPPADEPETQAACALQPDLLLQGYTFRAKTANHSDNLPLSLYWQWVNKPPAENIKYFVRLIDATGAPKWSADLSPGHVDSKSLPSSPLMKRVNDNLSIPAPPELPYGQYRLALGGYTIDATGNITPLGIKCSSNVTTQPDGTITLADIEVVERWGK